MSRLADPSTVAAHLRGIGRNEHIRAAGILLFLLHACFYPCIWGKKTLLESARAAPSILWQGSWAGKPGPVNHWNKVADPGAPAWQNEPWYALMHDQYLREGTLPLWNPYQAYGVPLAANMQSQPFYPLTFAFALHPTPLTYNFYILLRLFLAGFGCYLYARLFLSFTPALASGIACMLGGYYIIFITIPELSVAVLLPFFLFAGEYLLQSGRYRSIVWVAILILLVFLGGGPETTLLFFSFAYLYFLVRIVSNPDWRSSWWARVRPLAIATVAGLALSMIVLLPFAEYVPRSWNNHEPAHLGGTFRGLEHDKTFLAAFTYLFPLLFGAVDTTVPPYITYGIRNYFGIVSFFLALLAIGGSLKRKVTTGVNLRSQTIFFATVAIFVVLKRFGIAANFVGALPLFRLLDFPKYNELLLSVSIAVLTGIGLHNLLRRNVSLTGQSVALAISFLLVPFALFRGSKALRKAIFEQNFDAGMSTLALGLPVCLLMGTAILLIWFNRSGRDTSVPDRTDKYAGFVITTLLAIELCGNYIYPMYYQFARMPSSTADPYAGAPFVQFLKAHCGDQCRIVGQNGVLVPNWAAAFQISDVRYLDALYVNEYFAWLENFFPDWPAFAPELSQCFRGLGEFDFTRPITKRLLQLSSVKYIVGTKFFALPDPVIRAILDQNRGHLVSGHEAQISEQTFSIKGESRRTLGEHPPYERLSYDVLVPKKQPRFYFGYGVDTGAWTLPGDGVEFAIEVKEKTGAIRRAFSNYIDPKHNASDRRWMQGEIDLADYAGKQVELLFTTEGGPAGNTAADWAGWSDLRFGDRQVPIQNIFKPVYDREVKISEYDDVLPRAAVYYKVYTEPDAAAVLKRLADPSFDPFQAVVLNSAALSQSEARSVADLSKSVAKRLQAASIVSYRSQEVVIDATATSPALLLLNDTFYPGWEAEVDGQNTPVIKTNYYFRGVPLSPGKHRVRFVYRPRMFYAGASISILTALLLLAFGLVRRRFSEQPGTTGFQRSPSIR